ncbi:FG-GAP-like repeat-containing protein [Streptomyces sp. BE147]|uniref:FG-GAP-like repeat-containing protein n=1 Tax=Streptomyces sp. BE147 TaxID=3002524 RepID=UPI002E766BB0|nr:FG-GAP-like repeat-containing protein [Streptomyces sp. BE147]MEE1740243.1 FG-GAP-like repeat-containing protein [Streptomyces sp. BE147]
MVRHPRGGTALVTLVVLAAGAGAAPNAGAVPNAVAAGAAVSVPAAVAPADITIPVEMRTTPGVSSVMNAGPTGFLHLGAGPGERRLEWTAYDGSRTRPVDARGNDPQVDPVEFFGSGSDTVALPAVGGGDVSLRAMPGADQTRVTVPSGQRYVMTVGETVVTQVGSRPGGGPATGLHLLTADGTTTVDRPVTGVPEGAEIDSGQRAGARGFLSAVTVPGEERSRYGWVDLATAHMTLLPEDTLGTPVVAGNRMVVHGRENGVRLYEAGKFDDSFEVARMPGRSAVILGAVGDSLIVARHDPAYGPKKMDAAQWRISAAPFDGSPERELLARAVKDRLATRPDGGMVVMGGASALDYGFQAITAQPSGEVRVAKVLPIAPVPMATQRLLVDDGQVTSVEYGDERTAAYTYGLTSAAPGHGPRTDRGSLQGSLKTCGGKQTYCPELVATGDGRLVHVSATPDYHGALSVVDGKGTFPGAQWPTGLVAAPGGSIDGALVRGASGNLVLISGRPKDNAPRRLRVIDIDNGTVVRDEPDTPAALWGDTLWTSAPPVAGKMTLTARQVRTGAKLTTATVGSGCTDVSGIQAVGEWLFWRCYVPGAPHEAAGVYNTRTRQHTSLDPIAQYGEARLGQGAVLVADGGQVTRYDVRGATAVRYPLGPGRLPSLDVRTGDIAFRANDGIRVLRAGAPVPPLTSTYSVVTATAETDATPVAWRGQWWLSRPVGSWTLDLRSRATGRTVATRSGGAADHSLAASWDGRTAAGGLLPNGVYTWTLTARPADGAGAAVTTGAIRLTGGSAVLRDHSGDGFADVLTLNSKGSFTLQRGDGAGKLSGKTSGSGWPTSALAVPFGDLDNDRCNDVLVRMADGTLRGYRPGCGKALTPKSPYTKLGTGFQAYRTLTSPGDLTGDGRADLLGWKKKTGDVYLFPARSNATLAPGRKIRSKWTYTRIVGVGDLNGDGHGDLLATDKSKNVWRYYGKASGQFGSRVLIAKKWGASYDAVVGVGDISGDGKADLLTRDTSGRLFRTDGRGNGTFGGRTQIASGWQVYKGVF